MYDYLSFDNNVISTYKYNWNYNKFNSLTQKFTNDFLINVRRKTFAMQFIKLCIAIKVELFCVLLTLFHIQPVALLFLIRTSQRLHF